MTALLLCAVLMAGSLPVSAAEPSLEQQSVTITDCLPGTENQNAINEYWGYWDGSEFYLAAEDFAKITRYSYQESDRAVLYQLGAKSVLVYKNSGSYEVKPLNVQGRLSRVVNKGGRTYLPLSEMLPWMNVTVSAAGWPNTLRVLPDSNSIWEYVNDAGNYKFNLYEDYGDSAGDILALSCMTTFDIITHVRWDKLIPSADDRTVSHYDAKLYKQLFYEFAKEEYNSDTAHLLIEKTQKTWSDAQKINNSISSIEKTFNIDENKLILQLDRLLQEQYLTEQFGDAVTFLQRFSELRETITKFAPVHPFLMAALDLINKHATTVKTDVEFTDFLTYLASDAQGRKLVEHQSGAFLAGLDEAEAVYRNNRDGVFGMYIADIIQNFGSFLDKQQSSLTDKMINDLREVQSAVGGRDSEATTAILKVLFPESQGIDVLAYYQLAGAAYEALFPDSGGYTEIGKLSAYTAMQETMWDVFQSLQQQEMTSDTIAYLCQSEMFSLTMSKKCYQALQSAMNRKLFGVIELPFLPSGEGAMDYKIDPIDQRMTQLSLTASCRENDSAEDKTEQKDAIAELLAQLFDGELRGEEPVVNEEPASSEAAEPETSTTPTDEQLAEIYKRFVADNCAENYLAVMADVTRDGVPDLILINYTPVDGWEGKYKQNGFVYIWDPTGVRQILTEHESNAHGYLGLDWYLKKVDDGVYDLVIRESTMHQGYGDENVRELYLTNDYDGVVLESYHAGSYGDDPVSDEAYDKLMEQYERLTKDAMALSPFSTNIDSGLVLSRSE